jgi:nitroreductase
MNIKQAIKNRHSIRNFLEKRPSIEIINELIEYANLAPSAGNLQARDFIIIDEIKVKEALCAASLNQKFIIQAPYNIVVCANLNRISPYGKRGLDFYCIQDAAAAVENILLLAVDYGLDTCWVGAFNDNEVSKILNLPSHIRPIAIIPIGYANKKIKSKSRIKTEELIHYNAW